MTYAYEGYMAYQDGAGWKPVWVDPCDEEDTIETVMEYTVGYGWGPATLGVGPCGNCDSYNQYMNYTGSGWAPVAVFDDPLTAGNISSLCCQACDGDCDVCYDPEELCYGSPDYVFLSITGVTLCCTSPESCCTGTNVNNDYILPRTTKCHWTYSDDGVTLSCAGTPDDDCFIDLVLSGGSGSEIMALSMTTTGGAAYFDNSRSIECSELGGQMQLTSDFLVDDCWPDLEPDPIQKAYGGTATAVFPCPAPPVE